MLFQAMPLLVVVVNLVLLLSTTVLAEVVEDTPFNPLVAHGGIFQALPWDEFELAQISSLHATLEYDRLMLIVKEKLILQGDKLSSHDRKVIERFLKMKRPPRILRDMLSEEEREEIRSFHIEGEIGSLLGVIMNALQRLPDDVRTMTLEYLGLHPTPPS